MQEEYRTYEGRGGHDIDEILGDAVIRDPWKTEVSKETPTVPSRKDKSGVWWKPKSWFSKFMVVVCITSLHVFAGVVLWMNYQGVHVSEILITRFILALFGELGLLGAIRGIEEWGSVRRSTYY